MQGSWVLPSGDDECMDNKIYSDSSIKNVLPYKVFMAVISTKYISISIFLHFN